MSILKGLSDGSPYISIKMEPNGMSPPKREMVSGLVYHLAAGIGRGTVFTRHGAAEPPVVVDAPRLRPSTVPTRFKGTMMKMIIAKTANMEVKGRTRLV